MVDWKKYALYALIGIGLAVATVGADLVDSRQTALGLVLLGSAVAWGSMLLSGKVRWGRCVTDERFSEICYRSGFAAWWAVMAVLTTTLLALDFVVRPVSAQSVLLGAMAVSLVAYLGSTAWYERQI